VKLNVPVDTIIEVGRPPLPKPPVPDITVAFISGIVNEPVHESVPDVEIKSPGSEVG
jgi:hypothetical protein